MSNIYIQEPPALGKVILKTTVGDIDIELWTKEAPKACRNFIQLGMEGYYKGTIFHRVVPGFIVQGGDPNGDGTGGESVYGAPFKDEFHSRLRFNRRGLVAMANAGKDDNGSQFFFTLAATPELQNKHTIFGKVTGETVYNMLKLAEGEIGPDERPAHPHKIIKAEVIINPYTDIVPRLKMQEVEVEEKPKKKKERQGVKNFGLLSFGEEAEEDEGEAVEFRGKPKSTHDLLNDPKLLKKTAAELELEEKQEQNLQSTKEKDMKRMEAEAAVSNIRDKLKSKKEKSPERKQKIQNDTDKTENSDSTEEYYIGKERDIERRKERDRIRDEIKQLKKEMRGSKQEKATEEKDKSKEKDSKKEQEQNELYQKYIEEQEKYRKLKENIPKKGAARSRHSNLNRQTKQRKPWVKNLYGNRDYPDNYTDRKFLEELRKNLYTEKVTLRQAVLGSFRVVNRMCLCILFSILFVYMYNDWVATDTVVYLSTIISILGYTIYLIYKGFDGFASHFKTVLVYLVIGYLLSPILYTLTDTVSTDTIHALAVIMMCVHLLFFDYGVPAAMVSNSLSINAALFGSICLISRLSSPFDAFVLLTISVLVFVLSPMMFLSISKSIIFTCSFFLIFCLTVTWLSIVSTILLMYFLVLVFIVSVYCPYLFVKWQKYKDSIHGPWDEAIINDSDDLEDCLNS